MRVGCGVGVYMGWRSGCGGARVVVSGWWDYLILHEGFYFFLPPK